MSWPYATRSRFQYDGLPLLLTKVVSPSVLSAQHYTETVTDDSFSRRVSAYIVDGLQRGVPSLFNDVKRLYAADDKRRIIQQFVEDCREQLEATGKLKDQENDSQYSGRLCFVPL
jgi:hypothetical protein